jgi:KaiC/GvpD/RAD55 family RecA-like ATPase
MLIDMERAKTGIPGFDKLVEGGIPRGFNVLITGFPGTGKTIFGLQYLYNGAKQGEPGVYVSLDAPADQLKVQAKQFGWDFDALEKQKKVSFVKVPEGSIKVNIFSMIEDAVEETGAKRLVFDNLSIFHVNLDQFVVPLSYKTDLNPSITVDPAKMKDKKYRYEVMPALGQDPKGRTFYTGASESRIIYLVINALADLRTTNLIITDAGGEGKTTTDGVSEYVCDGVLDLNIADLGGNSARTLKVAKMRMTKHTFDFQKFEIANAGIALPGR